MPRMHMCIHAYLHTCSYGADWVFVHDGLHSPFHLMTDSCPEGRAHLAVPATPLPLFPDCKILAVSVALNFKWRLQTEEGMLAFQICELWNWDYPSDPHSGKHLTMDQSTFNVFPLHFVQNEEKESSSMTAKVDSRLGRQIWHEPQ